MTESQKRVLTFLKRSPAWLRPSQITPSDYAGGASSVGRVLSSLLAAGLVEKRKADRGNGTACYEYRAKAVRK